MKFEMPTCGGCRTCELACSFHFTGEFFPAVSSLKVMAWKTVADDLEKIGKLGKP